MSTATPISDSPIVLAYSGGLDTSVAIGWIKKLNLYFSGRKGYAIQLKITGFLHFTIGNRYMSNNGFFNIDLPNTYGTDTVLRDFIRCHQTIRNRKRADCSS